MPPQKQISPASRYLRYCEGKRPFFKKCFQIVKKKVPDQVKEITQNGNRLICQTIQHTASEECGRTKQLVMLKSINF